VARIHTSLPEGRVEVIPNPPGVVAGRCSSSGNTRGWHCAQWRTSLAVLDSRSGQESSGA
jgi:hypothetical protein